MFLTHLRRWFDEQVEMLEDIILWLFFDYDRYAGHWKFNWGKLSFAILILQYLGG